MLVVALFGVWKAAPLNWFASRLLDRQLQHRLAHSAARACSPPSHARRLLLLDEPFGALDAVVRKTLRAGLKEIVRSVGVTTIIVTHDQEEAFDLADKVCGGRPGAQPHSAGRHRASRRWGQRQLLGLPLETDR